MDEAELLYSDTEDRPLISKINEAIERFCDLHGTQPDRVEIHHKQLAFNRRAGIVPNQVMGCEIVPSTALVFDSVLVRKTAPKAGESEDKND